TAPFGNTPPLRHHPGVSGLKRLPRKSSKLARPTVVFRFPGPPRRLPMNAIRRLVVATLLAVWCFPAVSRANPSPSAPAPIAAEPASPIPATSVENSGTETATLAAREQQARQL